MATDKAICTIENDVFFRQPRDLEGLAPCSHDEADSRLMVHVADAANTYNSITTRTVDSNVVVFAVNAFGDLTSSLNELYVSFDTGNHYRPMH